MESDPTKDPDKQQRKEGSPKGGTPPIMDGGDQPVDKQERPGNSGGAANQPPGQNNNLTEPNGLDGNKKWTIDEKLKVCTIFISTLGLIGTIWALTNTTKTFNETRRQFEISNRPFIELAFEKIDSVQEGQKPVIYYTITNKGKFPAKITKIFSSIGIALANTKGDLIQKSAENSIKSIDTVTFAGIVPFSPTIVKQKVQANQPLTKGYADDLKSGQAVITLVVEIKYTNLVTKIPYFFIQVGKMPFPPATQMEAMKYDDNPE
jgi:hypothetical protein